MIDLEQLKADVAAGTPGPWNVESYECKADQSDVKYHETKPLKKGEKRKDLVVGDVLWSVPYQIGAIRSDHNHWAGTHLDVDEWDTRRIARLPELEATYIAQAAEIERLRGALGEIEKLGITTETIRVGDSYNFDHGYHDYETISESAIIARAALGESTDAREDIERLRMKLLGDPKSGELIDNNV